MRDAANAVAKKKKKFLTPKNKTKKQIKSTKMNKEGQQGNEE